MESANILVIDDEPSMLMVITQFLNRKYKVFSAPSTREADEVLSHEQIQVVVCDQNMPDECGLDFFARLRELHPHIQRILLTGFSESELFLQAINRAEVFRYLVKPIKMKVLHKEVESAVERYYEEIDAEKQITENEELKKEIKSLPSVCRTIRKSSRDIWKLVELGSGAVIAFAGLVTVVGFLTFISLYFLKDNLGIDIFNDFSLFDIFN